MKQYFNPEALKMWKSAVIQLEGAANGFSLQEFIGKANQLRNIGITEEERNEIIQDLAGNIRSKRFSGTAIFIKYKSYRYLLTARHVVHDDTSLNESNSRSDKIFDIIYRVPSFDEVYSEQGIRPDFLLFSGAVSDYVFSDPELDLAVISLNQRHTKFADRLEEKGYKPVDMTNLFSDPSEEGADVFTVGFPLAVSYMGSLPTDPWCASSFSLPTFAFGKVSMLHEKLSYFWSDLSIYAGNSGGPVVEGGKLVGIVSHQATEHIDEVKDSTTIQPSLTLLTRIPFGRIIKAKHCLALLSGCA